jgi:hypothetical protein
MDVEASRVVLCRKLRHRRSRRMSAFGGNADNRGSPKLGRY